MRRRLAAGRWAAPGTWAKTLPGDQNLSVDLHATLRVVSGGCWPWRPSPEMLYEGAEPWRFEDIPLLALKPHLALLTQCTHIVRHALAQVAQDTLIMYHDVALLGPALGPEGWSALLQDARDLRIGLHAAAVLTRVGEMWGAACPDDVLAALKPRGPRAALALAALQRPRWLGHRGRMAAIQACAVGSVADLARYGWRNRTR